MNSAQQTSFSDVNAYVQPILDRVGSWPLLGSPEWSALPDDSPAKLAAVFDGARHHALRLEAGQAARAEASRAIAAAADWGQVAQRVRDHQEFRAENPWATRRAS